MSLVAALLSLTLGLGFGIPCAFGVKHFVETGEVWTFMGFPTYGSGPFESIGVPTSTLLLLAFLAVCVAEVALTVLIVSGAPHVRLVSAVLLVIEMVFWAGFALPFGPPLGIARTALLFLP